MPTWQTSTHTYAPIPKPVRAAVLRQHQGICHVCGRPGATQVDHVIPEAEGGTNHPDNLAPIHPEPCHREKTQAEAARGRTRNPPPTTRRPAERHPGLR